MLSNSNKYKQENESNKSSAYTVVSLNNKRITSLALKPPPMLSSYINLHFNNANYSAISSTPLELLGTLWVLRNSSICNLSPVFGISMS